MEHLNVRFYIARAVEGLESFGAILRGPSQGEPQTIFQIREHHIRFLREARVGTPLYMTAGVLGLEERGLRVLQILYHSLSDEICAAFVSLVGCVSPRTGEQLPWPQSLAGRAGDFMVPMLPEAAPKGIAGAAVQSIASLKKANELGVPAIGRGVIMSGECDRFGRMRPEIVIGRISAGLNHLVLPIRQTMEKVMDLPGRVGGAALEYRILYLRFPEVGTPVQIRSGLSAVTQKWMRMNHWLIDSRTGDAFASAENISANLDLSLRKSLVLNEELLAELQGRGTSAMAL
jgi:acyl-CoA thioester hydrolase